VREGSDGYGMDINEEDEEDFSEIEYKDLSLLDVNSSDKTESMESGSSDLSSQFTMESLV